MSGSSYSTVGGLLFSTFVWSPSKLLGLNSSLMEDPKMLNNYIVYNFKDIMKKKHNIGNSRAATK